MIFFFILFVQAYLDCTFLKVSEREREREREISFVSLGFVHGAYSAYIVVVKIKPRNNPVALSAKEDGSFLLSLLAPSLSRCPFS